MPYKFEIQREGDADLKFMDEVAATPGGEQIVNCIQCGTCSGSCPTSYLMRDGPRGLIAKIRAGLRNEVLSSPDIWLCTSCYFCYVRCPQNIKVTDLMYALKRLSCRDCTPIAKRGSALGRSFMTVVNRYGRNNEGELLVRFFLRTNPIKLLTNAMIGLKLFLRGRMPPTIHMIKHRKQFRAIVAKAESMR